MAQQVTGNSQVIIPRSLDSSIVGGLREITVTPDGTQLMVHDGVTPGGHGIGTGSSGAPNSGVASFNGRVGIIALTSADVLAAGAVTNASLADALANYATSIDLSTGLATKAPVTNPNFIGTPTVPTATAGTQTTQAASTAFVMAAINTIVLGSGGTAGVASFNGRVGVVALSTADITGAGGAPAASPTLTGTVTVPTAASTSNTTVAASTAFVTAAIAAVNAATPGVTTFNTRAGAIVLNSTDISTAGGALLASPALTGTPTVPTATLGANTTQAASTAFVAAGLALKANLASPTFTGVPIVPTASSGTNTTQAASTAFVTAAIATVSTQVVSFNGRTGTVTTQASDISSAGGALLASPVFTGNPQVPTAAAGDSTGTIASTAFVSGAVTAILASGTAGVATFNGRTGTVVLTSGDVTGVGAALVASPALTGTPTVPTATAGTNTTQAASTAFVTAACAAVAAGAAGVTSFNTRTGAIVLVTADVTGVGGALLASPTFTGTPIVPTAAAGTNTGQAASTAFVTAAVAAVSTGGGGVAGVSSFNARAGAIVLTAADVTGVGGALLASPTFTGTPLVPTAAGGTNTTQAASTAFVTAAIAGFSPIASPSFTGVPLAPTAAAGVNTTQIATTAYALAAATVAAASKANSASPTFTGVPAGPTAAAGTNTTQLATTAFATTAANAAAASAAAPKAPIDSPTFTGVPLVPTAATTVNNTQAASTAYVTTAVAALQAWVAANYTATSTGGGTPVTSADGALAPPLASLVDTQHNVWTIGQDPVNAGVVQKNGITDTSTGNVVLLLWFGGFIYQKNSAGDFYKWSGTAWSLTPDPRLSTGGGGGTSPTTISFYGVVGHYIDGGVYSTNLTQQVADMQSIGLKTFRQEARSTAQMTTLLNLLPSYAPIVVQPIFNQWPNSAGSETSTYNTYFTYGQTIAGQFAGKVPVIELMNEPEVQYFSTNPTSNGQQVTNWAASASQWPALRGACRGFIDGFRSIDTTKKTLIASPSVGWLHYGILDGLWNGTDPGGGSGGAVVRWDLTNFHWYEDFGNIESAGNTATNVLQYLKNAYGVPIILTEIGVQRTIAESAINSYISTQMAFYATKASTYGIVGLTWYEMYNFQVLNGFLMGLFSAQNTQNSGRAAAMKAAILAHPMP